MAFEIKYSKEAEENLDTIAAWLLYERRAGETALCWLQGLREKIDTLSEQPGRCILARESKSLPFELLQLLYGHKPRVYRVLFTPGAFVSTLPAGHGTSSVSRNRFLFA